MKIDEWGLRRYKSSRPDRPSPGLSGPPNPPTPAFHGTSNANHPSSSSHEQTFPRTPEDNHEVEPSAKHAVTSQGLIGVESACQTLLKRYFKSEPFEIPQLPEWAAFHTSDDGPPIFKLIEALIPKEEQRRLNKEYLLEDLESQHDEEYPYIEWRRAWRSLRCSGSWHDMKRLLYEDGVISQVAGAAFLDGAFVVIAERELEDCRRRIEYLVGTVEPDSDEKEIEWVGEFQTLRAKYLEILADFRNKDFDVAPFFYEQALGILELYDTESAQPSRDSPCALLELADEYRRKYFRLIDRISPEGNPPSFGDGPEEGAGPKLTPRPKQVESISADPGFTPTVATTAAQIPWMDGTMILKATMSPPATPANTSELASVRANPLPNAHEVFEVLYRLDTPRLTSEFNDYAHSVITRDGTSISILDPCPHGGDNLFNILATELPADKQAHFLKKLLRAFASTPLTAQFSPWSLAWWNSLYASSSWESFQIRFDVERVSTQLERAMSPAAAKLVLDSTVTLVGERCLAGLKAQMVSVRRRKAPDRDAAAYDAYLKQYLEILKGFQEREMKVDQSWLSHLLNVM